MIPAHCRVRHDPENNKYGDCIRAAIASVLEISTDDVPHFAHDDCDGQTAQDRIREFLTPMGLTTYSAFYSGQEKIENLLDTQKIMNPDVHFLLFGATSNGDHVVVCRNGKVVHDPSWYPSKMTKAGSNGAWQIMVVAKR